MKKFLPFLLISIFLTGCTVNYDLEVDSEKIIEKINVNVNSLSDLGNDGYNSLTSKTKTVYFQGDEYYDVSYSETNNTLSSTFEYVHDINRYNNASVLDLCYPNRKIEKDNGKIIISTTGSLDCAVMEYSEDITNAKINIKTDLKVLKNNADEVNGNVYSWIINQTNYINKPIYIEMETENESTIGSFTKQLFIGAVSIFMLGVIVFLIVNHKNKKNNVI